MRMERCESEAGLREEPASLGFRGSRVPGAHDIRGSEFYRVLGWYRSVTKYVRPSSL